MRSLFGRRRALQAALVLLLIGQATGGQRAKQRNKYPRVIGAGFALTNVRSFGMGLSLLGYKVYHGMEYQTQARHYKAWNHFLNGKHGLDAFVYERVEYLEFNATLDFPAWTGYKSIMKWDPRGKVVLTVLDGGGMTWAKRWRAHHEGKRNKFIQHAFWRLSQIHSYWSYDQNWRWTDEEARLTHRQNHSATWHRCPIYVEPGDTTYMERCAASYERHIEEVKAHVPPDRLLIYNVNEGWEPLCKFLGAPVPWTPFFLLRIFDWVDPLYTRLIQAGQLLFFAICSWPIVSFVYSIYSSLRAVIRPHAKKS